MRQDYNVTVEYASKELTARERIAIKTTDDCIALDTECEGKSVTIQPDFYAVLQVYNEHAEDTRYRKFVIVAKDGFRYVTGSQNFFNSFTEIMNEMEGETEEFAIKIYKRESKNYKGKSFLTCSIV